MGTPIHREHISDCSVNDTLDDNTARDELAAVFGGAPHMSETDAAGKVALEYNVQNFNALVAANTAQQTEISSLTQTIADRDGRIEDMLRQVAFAEQAVRESVDRVADLKKEIVDLKNKLETAGFDAEYADDRRQEIQRKFDRQSGYLDRVLDQEDGYDTNDKPGVVMPRARPPVGPDFSDIAPPRRRQSTATDSNNRMPHYAFEDVSVRMLHPSPEQTGARPRRN